MTIVVFAGPSIRAAPIRAACPGARIHPPARQGDVLRAVRDAGATTIALIDGAFLDVPAVWHREILWALERGVRVLGAASMGALRAVELAPYGMEGVGLIFQAYRDGVLPGWDEPFEDDDEVAVIHAPAALAHAPLSDAMVDLRVTLSRAEAAGVLDRPARDAAAGRLKALHFPQRTLSALQALCADARVGTWLGEHHRSQKTEDATVMLRHLAQPRPPAPAFSMAPALTWTRFLADSQPATAAERETLGRLAEDPARWRRLAARALGHMALLRDARPGDDDALGAFRLRRGLLTHAALVDWARRHALDAPSLARLAQDEAATDAALSRAAGPALDRAILDLMTLDANDETGTPGPW